MSTNTSLVKIVESSEPPTLTLTVGLPRSGKSTWAVTQGVPVVNPDAIRHVLHGQPFRAEAEPMVWGIAKTMVRALFAAGHRHVILDATNLTPQRRIEWMDSAYQRKYAVFRTSKEVCIKRAFDQQYTELIPVIERMSKSMHLPEDEAFCTTIVGPSGE